MSEPPLCLYCNAPVVGDCLIGECCNDPYFIHLECADKMGIVASDD